MTTHNSIRLLLDRCHEWDKSARALVTERAAIMETARGLGMAAIVKKMVAWPKGAEHDPPTLQADDDLAIPEGMKR